MLSPSLEDYLEELYKLYIIDLPLKVTSLAKTLNVSSPSVIKGLKRLHKDNYIIYERYQGIIITPKGKALGEILVARNDIIKRFLSVIQCNCDLEAEAEAVEHFLSANTVTALKRFIDFFEANPDIRSAFEDYISNI